VSVHPRLINQVFENLEFAVDEASIPYLVRDIVNMNWWNTAGVHVGYRDNRRLQQVFPETQKRIAVQLKEYYYIRILRTKDTAKLEAELRDYIAGKIKKSEQLSAFTYEIRANPSQHFHRKDGTMTWVDCTSRATYAAKYTFQNGYLDFDGKARMLGAGDIVNAIDSGSCEDLGVRDCFVEGHNAVKGEVFSQKYRQLMVKEWIQKLGVVVNHAREWLLPIIGEVRTDPYKVWEAQEVKAGRARGLNEALYGYYTSNTVKSDDRLTKASSASAASSASHASNAINASSASRRSRIGCNSKTRRAWSGA